MKVIKWLDEHAEEALLVILLVVIACVSLLQVIVRKLPFIPSLTWAEEFCRFMWIWSVFLSLPYTIRKSNMLRVSVLLDMLPQVARKIINILVDLITAGCMLLLAVYSVQVVRDIMLSGETSPAMQWPMWIVYLVMLIGFVWAFLRGIQMAVIHVMHFNEKELSTMEQTMQDAAEEAAMAKGEEGGAK
jgi:TRAP-type C4-dicarboxylate transport system permease small subunit